MSITRKERLGPVFLILKFCVRCREDEAGFSLLELLTVIVILGFLIGMGIWVMFGAGSTTGARTAQGQIAEDLRLCAKKVETEKKIWGIVYYGKDYTVDPALRNMYKWYYFDGYGNDEAVPAECTIHFVSPPIGATPGKGGTDKVPLQDGANLFGTYGNTWPSDPPAANGKFLYLRFKPVGSTIVTQYGTGATRVWYDIDDPVANPGNPGYLKIDVSDRKGDSTKDVKIYKLGYIGFQ